MLPATPSALGSVRREMPFGDVDWQRESNACPVERNQIAPQDIAPIAEGMSGNCQELLCARCQRLAIADARLGLLLEAWPCLSEQVQMAIVQFIEGAETAKGST
jgi:hypothetical protein